MTDLYDRAQQLEARQRDEALARHVARQQAGPGLSHCEDCGEPILEARRRIVPGCRRCRDCQEEAERHG
ncbi:TraR/DksA family transcriptional regulator [Laribacter hongkongensis]|uniref:TraR/DksA family transcriptional regulator n=1 Tax=Laribacter hongkongensis TaxID=168471 RepID=UPI0003F7C28F|nr:TraR/DksA family transcriptional regulator [Laribacter hongkongensis]MCG8995065.1 TraR/DksA family transcriptional regulator [Laribacter hongkongensis]MCG8998446.1 TraR/DksA family transcriptional regulator [Laribacter hongkongensis]MCG9011176.1 TraR/DksA family transcriptional regulator [Laribacter hongkongensis]MCG9014540.1 TraR/DksA family transcriptional regulator [Laribacter hongkongensis]MCG9023575.1 TraR/DksA family transcriptional regulator [Laribacter hongkongensis]